MTSARVTRSYTPSSLVPYTTHPITISPIPQGTFVNTTHVSSTFLCHGCINSDSFDPAWADSSTRNAVFGYAFSQTAVQSPSNPDTTLSPHLGQDGGYGVFKVILSNAKSDEYDKYAALAEQPGAGTPTSTTQVPTATPTGGVGCLGPECETPKNSGDKELPRWEFGVLVALGAVCLAQAVLP